MNKILILVSILFNINLTAQLKVGNNKSTISSNTYFEIESTSGSKVVVRKDTAMMGINNANPKNKLEITHGTSGNSGLRFTDLTTVNTGVSSSSVNQRFLSVNNLGDVVLANSVDQVISVSGLGSNLVSPVSSSMFQAGTFENSYSKTDSTVLYLNQTDGTTWIYSAANGGQYKSYVAPASTAWFTSGTTNDAGNSKTSNIYRTGNVGIGANNPSVPLDVQSLSVGTFVTTAKFLAPSNTTAGNSTLLNFGVSATTGNSADWRYVYQGNGAASNRVDFGMSGYAAPMISYLNSGNVGIGTTAPATKLHIQGIQATLGANANATMFRMSRPTWSGFKWGSAAQFNLGTYDDGLNPGSAKSRLDIALTNGNDETTLTNVMTWLGNGNVGIGTTAPATRLDVNAGVTTANTVVNATGSVNDFLQYNVQNTSTGTKAQSGYSATADNGNATTGFAWMGINNSTFNFPTAYNIGGANDVSFVGSGQDLYLANANNTKSIIFSTGRATTPFFNEQMRILNNGNVGIGTNNPLNKLVVRGLNNQPSALGTAQTNAIFRVEGETNHALDMGTFTNSPWGSFIQSHNKAAATSLPLSINPVGGNVGIGTSNPTSRLEVDGAATNTTAFNAAAGTTIDFSRSNLAYTTASAGAFTLTNIKDGGTYTLAVQGTTSGTASFTATTFTFRLVNNVATIAGRQTLYTFIVMGTTVYVYMTTGF
jgi:hypothetical protein